MKNTISRKIAIVLLSSLMVLCVCLGVVLGVSNGYNASASLSVQLPEFEEYYLTNDEVELPIATMTLDNKTVNAQAIINYPVSKKAVATNKAVLDENGVYTVEYRGIIDGKMYVSTKTFTVYPRLYDIKDGTGVYGTSPITEDLNGVYVKLSNGGEVVFNEAIDLTGKKSGENVVTFEIVPQTEGNRDFRQLNVKFVDKYDPTNYVTISCRSSRDTDENSQKISYMKAGYKAQAQVGLEAGKNVYFEPSEWGEYSMISFYGHQYRTFSVSFDYENRTIYGNGKKIIELNNPTYFDDLWDGFTTGECYVVVGVQELLSMEASFMVTKLGNVDLSQAYLEDKDEPIITIDTDYDLDNLPKALVGTPYKLFDAIAEDYVCGEVKVVPSVYYAYTSSSKGQIDVVNGEFTPFIDGKYTIEYKAVDDNGNVGIKTVVVEAVKTLPTMTLSVGDQAKSWIAGHEAQVAEYDVTNANGNAIVEIIAKNKSSNNEYLVEDYKFVPCETGAYEIIYTATDYIGRTATDKYEITVTSDGLAVFKDDAVLPFAFVNGQSYILPPLKAYVYDGGSEQETAVKIFAKDSSGEKEITGAYVPSVTTSGTKAEIIYKATTASGEVTKSYKVPVQIIKTGKAYDTAQYFVGNITATASENDVAVATSSNQTVKFIQPLIANNFNFNFNLNPAKSSFNSLDIYLIDMEDPSIKVKYSLIKGANGQAYMALNDGVAVITDTSFTDSTKSNFILSYDQEKMRLSDGLGNGYKINTTVDGEPFDGFTSSRVYLEFAFSGVTGASEIKIKSINSQNFTSNATDTGRPQIVVNGILGGSFELGTTYTIPRAYALDVLDPTVIFKLSVSTPSGEYAEDKNGTILNGVDPSEMRNIVLNEFGYYIFSYSARDTSNRNYSFSTIINVPDTVAPTITIEGNVSNKAGLGDKVALPKATAYKNGSVLTKYDDIRGEDVAVDVVVFVICPNTRREVATRNDSNGTYTYAFNQKGEHTVVYLVYDAIGNKAEQRFTVKVS